MNYNFSQRVQIIKNHILVLFMSIFMSSAYAQSPNIIFILADDLGYGDLSCQGATDLLSPNIDSIAEKGLTFNNFYANSPVCSPSRAALLTGKYPDMVGVPGVVRQIEDINWGYLKEDVITLPQVLKSSGYHTAMIGKWHLGYESPNIPNKKGFDYFKGFLGDMMDDYWTHLRGGVNWMRLNETEINPKGHATDLFTDWAIDYVDRQKNNEQPFFLYLAYNAPHFPIQPPQEYLDNVLKREKGIDEKRAKNVAFVEHLDASVGKLLKHLESLSMLENTLIVFTSDNGGALNYAQSNGKLRGGKQNMFEGGIRVPTFAMWKGTIQPNTKTNNVGMLMDWLPTFNQLANGNALSKDIDGISILPTLLGKPQITDDRYLFWVRREGWQRYGGRAYYAARYNGYKILQNTPFESLELFNIEKDEYEKTSLNIDGSEIFKTLEKELQQHIRKSGKIPWQKSND
jgi:arylsulfatase A-like enzyme